MNPIYQQALNGTLCSNSSGDAFYINFINYINIPISISYCNTSGQLIYLTELSAGQTIDSSQWGGTQNGDYYVIKSALSGAFMTVISIADSPSEIDISLYSDNLCNPNDVGAIPQPNATVILPTNTPSVLVGTGTLPNGNFVTREQYWARMGDSYSLAPGETLEINSSQSSGLQHTSATQDTVNTSIGAQAGAGWGPFSASVTASLSTSSSTNQQTSISEETSSYITTKIVNQPDAAPTLVLKWGLMEVVTIFDSSSQEPIVSTESAQMPLLLFTYPLNNLELPAALLVATAEGLAKDKKMLEFRTKNFMNKLKSASKKSKKAAIPDLQ